LEVDELMCKAIKAKNKVRIKVSMPHMLSFFLSWYILLLIFVSFFKSNPKSQTTMDEHKHKILVILVFFMAICQVEKINISSIADKTNIEAPQEERKMKKDKNYL
jgi:hypothetical protein